MTQPPPVEQVLTDTQRLARCTRDCPCVAYPERRTVLHPTRQTPERRIYWDLLVVGAS